MAKLSVSQIKQIAGRAGRYRTADQNTQGDSKETKIIDSQDSRLVSFKGSVKQSNVGLVTCLDERDLADIQTALNSEPDPIKAAGLQPPVEFIDAFAKMLPLGTPLEYMLQRLNEEAKIHSRYFLCDTKDGSHVAACLDGIQELDIVQRCIFVASPADTRTESGRHVIKALARHVANRAAVTITDVEEIPLDVLDLPLSEDREYLLKLELLHKSLILYLWLSYRFSNIFLDREMAIEAKSMVEEKINTTLLAFSANPKLRTKLLQRRQIIPSEDALGVTSEDSRDEAVKLEATGLVEEELSDSVNALSTLSGGWEGRRGSEGFHPNAEELEIRQPSAAQP
jgi:ATP-dependent RNA helicase SUPV3L1/SUV3